eukprot:XP_001705192.1 High cysteine protein [Giardia lamblia ATCC 50803]
MCSLWVDESRACLHEFVIQVGLFVDVILINGFCNGCILCCTIFLLLGNNWAAGHG